ncbi:MAG: SgcJ/EcaC family oxidoreductase [Chitinophagaceae bacterium]
MKQFIIAALLLATTFCQQANAQLSDADTKSTLALYEKITNAFTSGDAAALAASYTENGTHISPDGQIITGRAALQSFFEKLFSFFKTQPKPDKQETSQNNWNARYLSKDLVTITYNDEQVSHFGDKTDKTVFALNVILKRTKDGWLCEMVSMTPAKPML